MQHGEALAHVREANARARAGCRLGDGSAVLDRQRELVMRDARSNRDDATGVDAALA